VSEPRLVLEIVGESAPPVELPRAGRLTLGSATGRVDFVLSGQGVADVHCAIGRVKGGGWALKDLGSNYGTILNGERVATAKLSAGDVLVLGSRRLRVVDPEAKAAEPPPPAPPPAPPAPLPPQKAGTSETAVRPAPSLPRVEGYRVEKPLGRGGMGQVYLAVQESLQRRVALKVLSEKLAADADFVRRFQAEARAAAALNHPNIVTVHDVWEAGGRHWLAMEYMDHGTLETRVSAAGQVPWREVLDVLCDAAKGLVYAELRGIVHRDIKPANLMQNEAGTTKIADLGLATHLEAEATDAGDRKIFGTPHFISPEQARGERVDARSDLYSLGATAYRLLTGHTPFEGATTREILRGHFFETPRPLSERAPDVPPELAAIVLKLLAKKPEERHPSAGALLQELERLRSHVVHGVGPVTAPAAERGGKKLYVGLAIAAAIVAAWFLRPKAKETPQHGAVETASAAEASQDPKTLLSQEPATDATAPAVEPVKDTEDALQRLERDAESAWRSLPAELTPLERKAELERLARAYAGSTWAARFEAEAKQLSGSLASGAVAESAADVERTAALDRLRAAAAGANGPLPMREALPAMLAVEVAPSLQLDATFQSRWTGAWREILGAAAARGRAALEEADRQKERGEFGLLERGLGDARDALTLPEAPLPDDLAAACTEELGALRSARDAIEERLDGLSGERELFDRKAALSEQQQLASALWRSGELERELRAFDLAAAEARIAALEGQLERAPAQGEMAALRADLAAARTAFEPLVREWSSGGWKRRTVNDPRSRGRANREAVNADARGVLVKDGDATELVGWEEFARRPAELHQLFLERLARAYTPSEVEAIAALMRVAAVLQAIDEGAEVLADPEHQVLSGEESQHLLEGFALAREWSHGAESKARLEREASAAALFAAALSASTERRWDEAVTLLERLLAEQRETLLVRLLSDGRALALDPASLRSARGG
jgi:Protein kinase domain/FHA domain